MTKKTPTKKTPTPAQRRKEAEHKVAALTATVEAQVLERTAKLLESPQPVVVPWSEYPAFDQFGGFPTGFERPYPWSDPDDRTEGRYRPYYETEQDLRIMRATARRMRALFPVAEGALEALTNYVIGEGYEVTAQPKKKEFNEIPHVKEMCRLVQGVVDRFLEYNNFTGRLDREIHDDSRTDGEAFLALYDDERDVRIDLVSPDYIVQPFDTRELERWLRTSHKLNHWWLGVHTLQCHKRKRDDATRPLGYHAVFDRTGDQWDYLPAQRVEHIKLNVGSTARHGVSDFFIVQKLIEQEAKISRNTAEGAAILAAIVMIREHAEGTSRSSVESMVSNSSTGTVSKYTQNAGVRTAYQEQVRPYTIKDTPAGMKSMLGPMGTLNQPIYIQVAQYLLRGIGLRWNMPEYIISSDASNGNYASSVVAESPFVKARENDQRTYGGHFERLIWKALRIYHDAGAFGPLPFEQIVQYVKLKFDYPEVASRDKKEQAEVSQTLSDLGVISKRTIASQFGLDLDEEQQQIDKEPKTPKKEPSGFGSPFGRPFGGPPQPMDMPRAERLEALAAGALKRLTEAR
jgi:hypothetical protein